MDPLAEEFKSRAIRVSNNFVSKLNAYGKPLPISPGVIACGITFYLSPMPAKTLIEHFILESHHYWDMAKDRDDKAVIKTIEEILATVEEYEDPTAKQLMKTAEAFLSAKKPLPDLMREVLAFTLKNREEILGEEFERQMWDEAGELIKIAIKYTHLRRVPRPNPEGISKYTVRFADGMSVKKEAEKWRVMLS